MNPARLDAIEAALDSLNTRLDAFNESDHPRDPGGKFTSGGGGGGTSLEKIQKLYPHSSETHNKLAQYHEEQGAKHYQNASLQAAHLKAKRMHQKAAVALKSRSAEGRKLSNAVHNFSKINRLGGWL